MECKEEKEQKPTPPMPPSASVKKEEDAEVAYYRGAMSKKEEGYAEVASEKKEEDAGICLRAYSRGAAASSSGAAATPKMGSSDVEVNEVDVGALQFGVVDAAYDSFSDDEVVIIDAAATPKSTPPFYAVKTKWSEMTDTQWCNFWKNRSKHMSPFWFASPESAKHRARVDWSKARSLWKADPRNAGKAMPESKQELPFAKRRCTDIRDTVTFQRKRIHSLGGIEEEPAKKRLYVGNVEIHESHHIRVTRGLAWCMQCGCFGSIAGQTRAHGHQLQRMGRRCEPATKNDLVYKRKLERDELPDSRMLAWPDGTLGRCASQSTGEGSDIVFNPPLKTLQTKTTKKERAQPKKMPKKCTATAMQSGQLQNRQLQNPNTFTRLNSSATAKSFEPQHACSGHPTPPWRAESAAWQPPRPRFHPDWNVER